MQKLKEILGPFKKPLILIGIIAIAFIVITKIVPVIKNISVGDSPIVSITAKNDKTYKESQEISAGDFKIKATHENGKTSTLNSDKIALSKTKPTAIGETTKVTVSLKDNKNINCDVKVKNHREEVVSFKCGTPNKEDVVATYYDNGELCFKGTGDVMQFDAGSFPWQDSDKIDDDNPIRSVSFDGVEPASMDYWFEDEESLTYVAPIPSSVQSMDSTFSSCIALEKAPDWSNCSKLANVRSCYSDCEQLVEVPELPEGVKNASEMLKGCSNLQNAPEMGKAKSLSDISAIYEDCKALSTASELPDGIRNMSSAYKNCINLVDMPEIPESVVDMSYAFSDDVSLTKLTIIPKNVKDVSSCFSGCSKIEGMLWVDATPKNYNGCFSEAAIATDVDLQGNSKILNILAYTKDDTNITVNGEPAIEQNITDIEIED